MPERSDTRMRAASLLSLCCPTRKKTGHALMRMAGFS